VKSILDKTEQLDALTTSLDLEKAELRAHAAPFYFTHWHGHRRPVQALCHFYRRNFGHR